MKSFWLSKANKWTRKLIQLDPHQALYTKEEDRQAQPNSYKQLQKRKKSKQSRKTPPITKTYLYNFDPLKPHFY